MAKGTSRADDDWQGYVLDDDCSAEHMSHKLWWKGLVLMSTSIPYFPKSQPAVQRKPWHSTATACLQLSWICPWLSTCTSPFCGKLVAHRKTNFPNLLIRLNAECSSWESGHALIMDCMVWTKKVLQGWCTSLSCLLTALHLGLEESGRGGL